MRKVSLAEKFAAVRGPWNPHIVAELNGQHVKVVKIEGEFVWHQHAAEDEMFLVVSGVLQMDYRDREGAAEHSLEAGPGEFIVVPRGVEHRPRSQGEVHVVLVEPAGTLNTGNVVNERTVAEPAHL